MRDDGKLVLGLSGRIRAGKSTLTSALAQRLGWPTASFGHFVRSQAIRRQIGEDRDTLQALGEELISTLGWHEFCERMLGHAGLSPSTEPCIIEGIRHVEALQTLRGIFSPWPVYLVHVQTSEPQREVRLQRDGISPEQAAKWSQHSTERDVLDALPALADLSVASDGSPDGAVEQVLSWLSVEG